MNQSNSFAIKREIVVRSDEGRQVALFEDTTEMEEAPGLHELVKLAALNWPGTWEPISVRPIPVYRLCGEMRQNHVLRISGALR